MLNSRRTNEASGVGAKTSLISLAKLDSFPTGRRMRASYSLLLMQYSRSVFREAKKFLIMMLTENIPLSVT